MANQEHISLILQGVEVWNKWRKKKPDTRPDLSGAKLHDADLGRADLSDADLRAVRHLRITASGPEGSVELAKTP